MFDRLRAQAPVKHRKRSVSRDLPSVSVNVTGRGRELRRDRRASHDTFYSSPDLDYSPSLGEVLVHEEVVFRNTRSRLAIPYSYEQPSSSTAVASPEPKRGSVQWSDEEDEDSGYASSASTQCEQTEYQ